MICYCRKPSKGPIITIFLLLHLPGVRVPGLNLVDFKKKMVKSDISFGERFRSEEGQLGTLFFGILLICMDSKAPTS